METSSRTTIKLTDRVMGMQASPTLQMLSRAQELIARGVDVIDFAPGEPDFPTPSLVSEAGKRAIDEGHTKYTAVSGSLQLRNAIAGFYNRRYPVELKQQNIIAGTGGKQELFNLVLALVDKGDEVIIPSPYWVSFPDQVLFAGGTPVFARADPANGFRPTAAAIERLMNERTRGVILNSPCNPTGAVIERAELDQIVRACSDRGLFLIFDETYEFFVYGRHKHVSAIEWFREFPETVIVVNSLSKTFSMTGWRLGYAIGHPRIISAVGRIQSHSTSNPSSISQEAAIAALTGSGDEVRRMFEAYEQRRGWLVPALNGIPGFRCDEPDGAFYVFPDVSALYGRGDIVDSASLATYLLDKAAVAVVPGGAFGEDDFVRISYATSMENLHEGVRRIRQAVDELLAV